KSGRVKQIFQSSSFMISEFKLEVRRDARMADCPLSPFTPGFRSLSENGFSRRNLSDLCVSALNSHAKTAHRRDAENAENAQSSFFRQTPKGGTPNLSKLASTLLSR